MHTGSVATSKKPTGASAAGQGPPHIILQEREPFSARARNEVCVRYLAISGATRSTTRDGWGPGRVNMSERTWSLTRGLIDGEARGNIRIKEGREMPMFLAEGPVRELLDGGLDGGIPVRFAARYREEFGEEPRGFPVVKKVKE